MASMPVAAITFTASTVALQVNQSAQLSWNVPNSSACSASGGLPGDGWSGNLPATGTQSVSEGSGGNVAYGITCALSQGSVSSSLNIAWDGPIPNVQVYLPRPTVWVTRPAQITWTSNVSPCSPSGGGLSLSGLPSSGSTSTTQTVPGDATYQVSCGSGPTATSTSQTESYVTPSLFFIANATDRIVGQSFGLGWSTYADTCTVRGRSQMTKPKAKLAWRTSMPYPRVTTPGTYTYTLSCSSGTLTVQQSVAVTFENNAPYVSASVSPSSVTYSASPADYITINWATNLSSCGINSTPVIGTFLPPPVTEPDLQNFSIDGPAVVAPNAPRPTHHRAQMGAPPGTQYGVAAAT